MKKEFENLYQYLLMQNENELQEIWQEAKREEKKSNIIFCVVMLIIDFFIIWNFGETWVGIVKRQFVTVIFTVIPLFIIHLFVFLFIKVIFSKQKGKYNQAFKELIVDGMLKNFYTQVDYIPKKQMPKQIYDEAKYAEYYERYSSDDYMEAKIDDKYDIKMAEVQTTKTTKDSDGNSHTVTVFHGIFAKIKMDKSIQNDLTIRPNGAIWKNDRLEMDSQEFEKIFDVSSENKIVGMQLLTHDVMELLVDFYNENKIRFYICIYDNIIYLRLATGSMFEIRSLKKGVIDKTTTEKYYNILNFMNKLTKVIINMIENTQV